MSDLATASIDLTPAGRVRPRMQVGMTTLLAWRNLTQERVRFIVTLVGIVFAVVLMAIQSGLLYGFATTASSLVDRAGADIWIAAPGVHDVDQTVPIDASRRFEALSVPGVASAQKYLVKFSEWIRPDDGGSESVLMVGFDLATGAGGPWNLVTGSIDDLKQPDGVIIDQLYREKLGVTHLGQTIEINGHRARVVGFTRGVRTFTQSPYVFASFKTAQSILRLREDQASYVLVKLAAGADRADVERGLKGALHDVAVISTRQFALRTQIFWLFTTGAGVAVLVAAILGLVIGIVITGQTLYATTVDRLAEYATLRAVGAPVSYLRQIILKQAAIAGGIGYAIGIAVAEFVAFSARNGSMALLLPHALALALAFVTVGMCCAAALLSIRKVGGLSPTSVFR